VGVGPGLVSPHPNLPPCWGEGDLKSPYLPQLAQEGEAPSLALITAHDVRIHAIMAERITRTVALGEMKIRQALAGCRASARLVRA
jgi:hypothetical protein